MSQELQQISHQLVEDLGLKAAPIQISYMDAPPAGVPMHPGGAPSVCTFFAEGQTKPFYADMKAHEACEIGAGNAVTLVSWSPTPCPASLSTRSGMHRPG